MAVCAVNAWLVRCKWLGMLANKMLYKEDYNPYRVISYGGELNF